MIGCHLTNLIRHLLSSIVNALVRPALVAFGQGPDASDESVVSWRDGTLSKWDGLQDR